MPNFKVGQFIRFTYNRPQEAIDQFSGDRHKEIFVLNPQWLGEVHGIDLKRLTTAEREVLVTIFDPKKAQRVNGRVVTAPIPPGIKPLVDDIMRRMDPRQEITNPLSFYHKFVKPFLKQKDAYRKYKPSRMQNITVSRKSTVLGKVVNPKPLFHKEETPQQATPFKPKLPGSEHGNVRKLSPAEIQAMAAKMGVKVSNKPTGPTAPNKPTGPTKPMTGAERIAAMKAAQMKARKK